MAFCDWLSIRQTHPNADLPIINGGCVVVLSQSARTIEHTDDEGTVFAVDSDSIKYTLEKKLSHEGSYDSRIMLRCDGRTVELSGNVGRYNRPDNLFGYSVKECINRASALVRSFGLPGFTDTGIVYLKGCDKYAPDPYSARISAIHLTQNYRTGSPQKAARLIHYFAGHQQGRLKPKSYPNGVSWGEGSKYWYAKLYIKSASLGDTVSARVREYAELHGIVRHEISLKSRYLTQAHLNTIDAWTRKGANGMTPDNVIYDRFSNLFDKGKNSVHHDPYNDLPMRLSGIAQAWRNGRDIWNDPMVSKASKYRYRNELLPFGIDIKYPCDVTRLATAIEVIKMASISAPSWYWIEENQRLQEAA